MVQWGMPDERRYIHPRSAPADAPDFPPYVSNRHGDQLINCHILWDTEKLQWVECSLPNAFRPSEFVITCAGFQARLDAQKALAQP